MNIADIYDKFNQIGCLTFATIDEGYPQTRIAHLFAYDHEGLYFRTMITKAFYKQLKKTEKVSICGMFPETSVSHDDEGMPYFPPGYNHPCDRGYQRNFFGDTQGKSCRQ
jgi:hypothetical protein